MHPLGCGLNQGQFKPFKVKVNGRRFIVPAAPDVVLRHHITRDITSNDQTPMSGTAEDLKTTSGDQGSLPCNRGDSHRTRSA